VEGSSSYQAEWQFLEALKGPSDFGRSPSTLSMRRGFDVSAFSALGKGKIQLKIHSKTALDSLEKAQIRFFSTMLKLLMAAVFGVMPCSY